MMRSLISRARLPSSATRPVAASILKLAGQSLNGLLPARRGFSSRLPAESLKERVGKINLARHQQSLKSPETSIEEMRPSMIVARQQEIEEYEEEQDRVRWAHFYWVFGAGLWVFGTAWLVVPFYKIICEKTGLSVTTHAKEFRFEN